MLKLRAPRHTVAGLALIALAAFALWAVSDLSQGTLRAMGPAMLPRVVAVAIGVCGLIFVALGFLRKGEPLAPWELRGPLIVGAGMVVFALAIRTLGFAVAAPLAMIIAGYGTTEARPKELVVFAAVMTAFCLLLFRYLLDQPIPVLVVPGTDIAF
jgi:hypothetical protein